MKPRSTAYADLTDGRPGSGGSTSAPIHKGGPVTTRLKRLLALALAGGSLAIAVPAALAATGDGDPARAPAPTFIQEDQDQARPDREDCPEKDGARGGGGDGEGSSAEQGSATP